LALVDEFVVYDDSQYAKRDWRNRNKIKVLTGLEWLSMPVNSKTRYRQKINEVEVTDPKWRKAHLKKIRQNYQKAGAFHEVIDWVESIYNNSESEYLTDINVSIIKEICQKLGITVDFIDSRSLELSGDRTEKLINVCAQREASEYFTGP
jgi:hypothetical protein